MSIALSDTVALHPLVLPARADAADAADLRTYADIRNASLFETTGRDEDCFSASEVLPLLRSDADATRQQWIVRDGGDSVGVAILNVLSDDDGRTAYFSVNVLRAHWGRGIGSAVMSHIEQTARDSGVHKLILWTEHADHGEDRLDSPTGFGSVPLDHHARFLRRHGFALEQVTRVSMLELDEITADTLAALQDEAQTHAHDYRTVQWMLPTPAAHVKGYAWMKSRMSTDAPDADLDMPEEIWDADRVARHDEKYVQRGRRVLVTAAEHIATGELCAFNELSIGTDAAATTNQEDTLVLSDHRGHRLGMLVKAAGLRTWRAEHPQSRRVITYNAEENRPMLSINEAIGFAPIAYEGVWRKDLV